MHRPKGPWAVAKPDSKPAMSETPRRLLQRNDRRECTATPGMLSLIARKSAASGPLELLGIYLKNMLPAGAERVTELRCAGVGMGATDALGARI